MTTTTEILAQINSVTEFRAIPGLSERRAKAAHVLRSNGIAVDQISLNACEWSDDFGVISENFTETMNAAKLANRAVRQALRENQTMALGLLAKLETETARANWSI